VLESLSVKSMYVKVGTKKLQFVAEMLKWRKWYNQLIVFTHSIEEQILNTFIYLSR
jgi:hypothetical protein